MNPVPNLNSFQNQLANLQQSYAQLGQMFQPTTQQPTLSSPVANTGFEGVDGIEGAHTFLAKMGASTKAVVWDNQKDCFYVLQKDANGNAMRVQIGDFTLRPEPTMEDKYVTREDFNALADKIEKMFAQKGETVNG